MGKGSSLLHLLWGRKNLIPSFSQVFISFNHFGFQAIEICRAIAFILGIIIQQTVLSKDLKSECHSLRHGILKAKSKFIYIHENQEFWILLAPTVRFLWTSDNIVLANLSNRRFRQIPWLGLQMNRDNFIKLLWTNRQELMLDGYLLTR